VQELITPQEFAQRAVGVPWRKWRSDFDGMDCFGLIVLYFRMVLGIDLGPVPQTDIATGFFAAKGWTECEPEAGATAWMAWRNGAPTHCGVVLPGSMLLHSEGSEDRPGNVRITRLAVMRRTYGDILFYRYSPC
jgi:cell wall-associated NlpC family hydrolase